MMRAILIVLPLAGCITAEDRFAIDQQVAIRGYTRAEEMLKNYYGPWGRDLSPLFREYNFL